jgi:hypothetical protein
MKNSLHIASKVFLYMMVILCCGSGSKAGLASTLFAQTAPPHAASTNTQVFGRQTWSDAIRMPDCNKTDFENSDVIPQCRSYTNGDMTYYYYNWPYVNRHASRLCPAPWRVPEHSDFVTLMYNSDNHALVAAWVYGGNVRGKSVGSVETVGYYWSSTEIGKNNAYYMYYISGGGRGHYRTDRAYGMQVRCVR